MKSVMSHNFSMIPDVKMQRSAFNRSHGYKTTFDAGYLVPVFIDEALPGDTFNLRMTTFARLATPLKPIMDNMFMDSFFFSVPIRLIWDNWQKFNGEQINPGDDTDFLVPQLVTPSSGGAAVGSLSDYFGIPTGITSLAVNSLWHRAYNLIWNEWFRDQNLQDSVIVDKDDGPDDYYDYVLLRRGKRHDYFTSCLPWPQKGAAVELPLGSVAPVVGDHTVPLFHNAAKTHDSQIYYFGATTQALAGGTGWPAAGNFYFGNKTNYKNTGLVADLSAATASTINAIREAFQIQRLLERDARGGTRYTEILRSHFGVISPDARLQRPEYLGGGSTPVHISPIAQTTQQDTTGGWVGTPQGNLAAMGTASGSSGFTKSFTEHCVLIGLVSVRADLTYQQGLNRMFSRQTRWDFYWPSLANLGEQAVLNKEIYAKSAGHADNNLVFGYQERFAEYRYKPSLITGQFRSTYANSLDMWHLSQEFASLPVLSNLFIQEDPPIDRVIAVPSEPHFLFDSYFDLKCVRPMPVYSVPGLIDHF